jgi:eukaryotic-like serine/threonine-protein kinase
MVRILDPLDIALGDFGLVRMIDGSVHLTNRKQGSRAWAPPPGEAVSRGWDWWSLGMIVAWGAAAHHPFEVEGQILNDAAIEHLLSQTAVDLSGISDDRIKLLCTGLLTRNLRNRWGTVEVSGWIAGESPKVHVDSGIMGGKLRQVRFEGIDYDSPVLLADALLKDWDQAQERLAQRTDPALVVEVRGLLVSLAMNEAVALLDDTGLAPPAKLAQLLLEMNPNLEPKYRNKLITTRHITERLATDPKGEVDRIESKRNGYLDSGVLHLWRHIPSLSDGPSISQALTNAQSFLQTHSAIVDRDPSTKAPVYIAALNPDIIAALPPLTTERKTLAAKQPWWQQLTVNTDSLAAALAHATADKAELQTRTQEKVQRAEKDRQTQRERQQQELRHQERRAKLTERLKFALPCLSIGIVGSFIAQLGRLANPTSQDKWWEHWPPYRGHGSVLFTLDAIVRFVLFIQSGVFVYLLVKETPDKPIDKVKFDIHLKLTGTLVAISLLHWPWVILPYLFIGGVIAVIVFLFYAFGDR